MRRSSAPRRRSLRRPGIVVVAVGISVIVSIASGATAGSVEPSRRGGTVHHLDDAPDGTWTWDEAAVGVVESDKRSLFADDPNLAKVDTSLLRARLGDDEASATQLAADPVLAAAAAGAPIDLDIVVDVGERTARDLTRAGLDVAGVYPRWDRAVGRAPLDALDAIAAVDGVISVRRQLEPVTHAGSVENQADEAMRADVGRAQQDVDGSGVTIGVMSDTLNSGTNPPLGGVVTGAGCDRAVTGMVDQVTGDLPATVGLLSQPTTGTDEGAAMAELIHDVAPGADLVFRTGVRSAPDMAVGIQQLRNCGADIIVDDIGWLAEPFFQDGVVASAAQEAADAGVVYFSSAGNAGPYGIDERYVDRAPGDSGDNLHDFGGTAGAGFDLAPGRQVTFVMQWSEPYGSPASDYDLYLFDTMGQLPPKSDNPQGCGASGGSGGTALEGFTVRNTGSDVRRYLLVVDRFCGPASDARNFRIVANNQGGFVGNPAIFDDAQIFGQPAAADAIAVAAIDYCEVQTDGALRAPTDRLNTESFTSVGGALPFYFDADGDPLNPSEPNVPNRRDKPDLTAPDGSNTTFFGADRTAARCGEPDGAPNFFGTSAAAPHAAAVAALLLEADPTLTPEEIEDLLVDTAIDTDAPGYDYRGGAGTIDAAAALAAVPEPPPPPPPTTSPPDTTPPPPRPTVPPARTEEASVRSLAPARFADTRSAGETVDARYEGGGPRPAGSNWRVRIAGRGQIPADAEAVVMNVTAVGAEGIGFVTVHPCVAPVPLASSLNYTAGVNLGNEIVAPLDADGDVCLYTSATTHVTVDAVGFVPEGSETTPITPARYLDTRPGTATFDGVGAGGGRTRAGGTIRLPVAGRGDVPADAAAVLVNVTAINPEGVGYVTVHPCLADPPNAASLNHVAGVNRGNELIARLDADGDLCLFTSASVHLSADVVGHLPAGGTYDDVGPSRLLDTRPSGETIDGRAEAGGRRSAGSETTLQVAGRAGIPPNATSAVVNLTAIAPAGVGFVTVHPCQANRPLASSLNYVPGVNGGNEVVARLDAAGRICLSTSAEIHLTVDVVGFFTDPAPA